MWCVGGAPCGRKSAEAAACRRGCVAPAPRRGHGLRACRVSVDVNSQAENLYTGYPPPPARALQRWVVFVPIFYTHASQTLSLRPDRKDGSRKLKRESETRRARREGTGGCAAGKPVFKCYLSVVAPTPASASAPGPASESEAGAGPQLSYLSSRKFQRNTGLS